MSADRAGDEPARHPDAPQTTVEWARNHRDLVDRWADSDRECAWVFQALRQSLEGSESS